MNKLRYNLPTSESMPRSIQTKNRKFYLDYVKLKIQQLKVRIDHIYQTSHKLASNIPEIIPVKSKKMLYFNLLDLFFKIFI
jgi:hypothetical protein